MEILFPKKGQKKQNIRKQINEYELKLKGLKSVLSEISQDMEEIEPTVNNSQGDEKEEKKNKGQKQKLFSSFYQTGVFKGSVVIKHRKKHKI